VGDSLRRRPGLTALPDADLGGWVRVYTDERASVPEDLVVYLSQTLAEWFRQRPQLLRQCVVPVSRGGDTVELHAWYRVHVLPALQGPAPSEPRPRGR
jgi:hypothetical protein